MWLCPKSGSASFEVCVRGGPKGPPKDTHIRLPSNQWEGLDFAVFHGQPREFCGCYI